MRRNGYIVLALAAFVWVVVAVALGTGDPSGARAVVPPSGPSPACLPTGTARAAALAGVGVDVSPAPESDTASSGTQISFLGVPVTDVQQVVVRGSRSGAHEGHLSGYYQGDGGSFLPRRPFDAGERVQVSALVGAGAAARRVSFGFRIATAYPASAIPTFPNPPAAPSSSESFVSAPGVDPPLLHVTSADRDPGAGDLLMTTGPGPGRYGPLIFTPQGRLVWFEPLPAGVNALDLNVQSYEGRQDLTMWRGRVLATGFGLGENVVVDDNYQTVATVRAGNGLDADLHDFQIAPGEVAYITAYNVMRCDLTAVGGSRNGVIIDTAVQEIDIKTGLVRWQWDSLDHVGVRESHAPVTSGATPWDWFHLNSVAVEPDGNLLISARSTWAAYQLHAGSGEVMWRLGGTRSSFTMGPGTETAWQHDARLLADGSVTIFDDGSNPRVHYQSRAIRERLNTTLHTATLVHAYPHPGGALMSDSQGNAQALPGSRLVVGWGSVPSMSEIAPDGTMLLDAHLPPGYSSYRAFRFPWNGHPLTPPALSARVLASGDSTAVFASWNGATGVASWRVLAGASPAALAQVAVMPMSGFESSVTLPDAYPYVAVQALDAGGALLATSAASAVKPAPAAPKAG